MSDWFTIDQIDTDTYCISEYRHWEETHCYLLCGSERALLIDTGLGVKNIHSEAEKLTDKPIIAVATHVHWDHIGGHKYFPEFYTHRAELDWLTLCFPLPMAQIRADLARDCTLPPDFDLDSYQLFRGSPSRLLDDGDFIDIGSRRIQALHTPGHSPGHMCFFDRARGLLFSGDLIYAGTLHAFYSSTDPAAYLESVKRVAALPVRRVLPGHHELSVPDTILKDTEAAFLKIQASGKLHHGSGTHDFGYFSVRL